MTPTREEWRPVLGFEHAYEVSDLGRVRSVDRLIVDSRGRRQPWRGRLLRPHLNRLGRWTVGLRDSQHGHHNKQIAPLVLEAFVGPKPPGMECCHNNGTSTDNRLANLRWDTKSANMLDKIKHGTNHQVVKTHCPRRHLLAPPNLAVAAARNGHRQCRACQRAHAAMRRKAIDFQAYADAAYERINVS